MKVHNPSFGEAVDRLSILLLKTRAGEKKNADVDHFIEEQSELLEYVLVTFKHIGVEHVKGMISLMTEINTQIWNRIDLAHNFEMPDGVYAALSRNIVRLNDLRASRIHEINERFCPGRSGREKI